MHVVDPKILLAAVTQGAHSIFGALLGLVFGHAALGRQAVEMHQDAMRRLHRLANAVLALAQEHGPLRRHEHADQHRHGGHGNPHQHHQAPRHAEFEQIVLVNLLNQRAPASCATSQPPMHYYQTA
jgi:hypothetical protein